MTSPAVVILTEPTHCELADVDTLVQALLQVQQLSQAGVPVSQAFCDHPADAMKFIDAYTKAYPGLQLQSSDMPVPEHLYSMLADGRLNALQAPDSRSDATKLEDASRLQPLYVLSLGTPEILMQALRDKRLANHDIQVVEIAPIEDLDSERLSVSEAVAVRTVAGPSWLAERSAESRAEDQELLPLGESGNAPLKLESVELDLDRIEIHEAKDQIPAASTVVDTARVIRANEDAGANRPVQGKAPTSDEPATKDTTVVPPAPAASEPASESRDTARTEAAESSTGQASALNRDAAKLSEPDLVAGDGKAGDGKADDEQPAAEETAPPDKLDPGAGEIADAPGPDPDPSGGEADDGPDASDVLPSATDRTGGDTGDTHSFSDPDDDVLYPPSGGFTSNEDDLAYSLPPDGAPGPGILDDYLGMLAGDDILDLEAIGRSLPPAGNDESANHLDPVLMRPPGSGEHGSAGPITPADASASYPDAEEIEHDRSDAHDRIVTTLHDLDI